MRYWIESSQEAKQSGLAPGTKLQKEKTFLSICLVWSSLFDEIMVESIIVISFKDSFSTGRGDIADNEKDFFTSFNLDLCFCAFWLL